MTLHDAWIGAFVYRRLLAGGDVDVRFVHDLLALVSPSV